MLSVLRIAVLWCGLALPAVAENVTVFAAASLGDALQTAAARWEQETGHTTTLVFAGSATLARQIDAGAPADVFLSANVEWMDWLAARGRIAPDSQRDIASNTLVLIAVKSDQASDAFITSETPIETMLGPNGRLAIALPDAVPAGIYGKAALQTLGHWEGLAQKLAPTDNVRAALALVALREAPLGIVYATDAKADDRVALVGVFPPDSHPLIRYPGAIVTDTANTKAATTFLDWLVAEEGQAALAEHGFAPPKAEP